MYKPLYFTWFLEHAGYSYRPDVESEYAGRVRCALDYAAAYARLMDDDDLFVSWDVDRDVDSADFSDEWPSWDLWTVTLMKKTTCNECGHEHTFMVESVGAVDFGRNGSPNWSAHARCLEAELAHEYYSRRDAL
jgi:hypothetical protein